MHFRIGVVPVSLDTPIDRILNEYASLYGRYRVDSIPEDALVLKVKRRPIWLFWRPRYEITGKEKGSGLFPANEREVLPHLEWAINWQIALYLKKYLQIHASSVELGGKVIVFPGAPGSGKTTLCAGLLTKGAGYFSDEFALIEPGSLKIHPYPKALCIKESAIKLLEETCPRLRFDSRWIKKTKGVVAFLDPWEVRNAPVAQPAKVDFVIFPSYCADAPAKLVPLSKAEVVFNLNRHCLNFLDFKEQGIDMLADLVSAAPGFNLRMGGLDDACQLLMDLINNGAHKFSGP
jgi:HprK-related kinase A